jgi:hypothetical protein
MKTEVGGFFFVLGCTHYANNSDKIGANIVGNPHGPESKGKSHRQFVTPKVERRAARSLDLATSGA